jgi:hypothetical protein
MKEMISTLREACKENPGEVINSVLFLLGIFGVYLYSLLDPRKHNVLILNKK